VNNLFGARFDAGELAWENDQLVVVQPKAAPKSPDVAVCEAVLGYLAGTPLPAEVQA
jgi:hypothetical protein